MRKSRKREKRAWSIAQKADGCRIFTQAKFVPEGFLEVIHRSNVGSEVDPTEMSPGPGLEWTFGETM